MNTECLTLGKKVGFALFHLLLFYSLYKIAFQFLVEHLTLGALESPTLEYGQLCYQCISFLGLL